MDNMYKYKAIVKRVYDGDTIVVNVDLGFGVWLHHQKMRLARINAPEVRGANKQAGFVSRDWLSDHILYREIIIETSQNKGKFGRWITEVYKADPKNEENLININDLLVSEGYAEYKEY